MSSPRKVLLTILVPYMLVLMGPGLARLEAYMKMLLSLRPVVLILLLLGAPWDFGLDGS